MILFALALFTSSIRREPVTICFYDENVTECPPFALKYSVSNFSEFIDDDIPTSDLITFEFHALTKLEDVINISRFNFSELNIMEFNCFSNDTQSQPEFLLSTSNNFAPPTLRLTNVKPTLDFNTNFSELFLDNSPITIPDRLITADNLGVDSNSLKNIDIITADKIAFKNGFGILKEQNFIIKSTSENSKLEFISFNTALLKINIVLSNLLFGNQDSSALLTIDLSNWFGKVTVNHYSMSNLFTTLECLAYSFNYHFPYLIVNFANQLELPKSNWPTSTVPLIEIHGMDSFKLFTNKIAISGFIPAHIYSDSSDLTISPTIYSSGFLKLTVGNSNISISQPLLFTENYYFTISELETVRSSGNTTITADPPLMYILIEKFTPNKSSKSEFQLIGSANYILKNLPLPHDNFSPTVYVEHLWFENNVTFEFNLEDGVPNIRVLDFVLMKTWPTYFIPMYNMESYKKVPDSKHKLICAKLLKEQKEELMLPSYGFNRGFNRGASIVHSYYEQDPTTNQTLKCFGLDIHGNIEDVSTIFCLADSSTKSECPADSQFIDQSDKWESFVANNAGDLTFYIFRDSSLSFDGFQMVNVSVIGMKGSQKVEILPNGVDHLRLSNVDATLLADNSTVNVELTNSKLNTPTDRYKMGALITDPISLKSVQGRDQFEVQVTVKDVPDTKITVTKEGSVTLIDSDVTFKSQRQQKIEDNENDDDDDEEIEPSSLILIKPEVSSVVFTFEDGAGDAIENNTIIAKFTNSSSVSFNGLSSASRFFVLDGLSGTLDFGKERSIPIDLINVHDITIKASEEVDKLTFDSELDLDGSFISDVEIHSNRVRVIPGAKTSDDSVVTADHFALLEDSSATMKSLTVKNSLTVYPGAHLSIQNTEELPSVLTVNYKLENLPLIEIGKNSNKNDSKYKPSKIVFNYNDDNFNTAIMNRTLLLKNGLEIVSGSGFDCSTTSYEFYSPYVYYYGIYSLLKAECSGDDHNAVKLYINPNPAVPPTASPAPLIPTQTPAPNNTKQQVIIISMTVVTFFLIIVIVIIKCMNRKKKYVSKNKNNDMDTQPMLIPNEGNAE